MVGIVQTWFAEGTSACASPSLASTPTPGNLLICWLFTDNEATNSIYVNTIGGWIVADGIGIGSNSNGQVNAALCYRYADGLSQGLNNVVSGNYGGYCNCIGLEVQSIYPTWSDNVVDLKHNFGNTTTQYDTVNLSSAGSLSLLGYGWNDYPNIFPAAPTNPAGWSVNTTRGGLYQFWELLNKAGGTTATVSYSAAGGLSTYIALVLGDNRPPPDNIARAFPITSNRLFPINTRIPRTFPRT